MATLTLKLPGAPVVELDGQPLRFSRRSSLALLIYLACTGRLQTRATLATLIAGESDESKAAMAVSNALRNLRAVLGDDLQADKQMVTLAPTLAIALDVADFEAAARLALVQEDLKPLRTAAATYGASSPVASASATPLLSTTGCTTSVSGCATSTFTCWNNWPMPSRGPAICGPQSPPRAACSLKNPGARRPTAA